MRILWVSAFVLLAVIAASVVMDDHPQDAKSDRLPLSSFLKDN